MALIKQLFGQGTDLSALQMLLRGIVVFLLALLILRIAGKRTFGKMSATDNVVMIMLGAILSRAVVGASPFIPVILCSFGIVFLHRLLAWLSVRYNSIGFLVKGEKTSLFREGVFNIANMQRCMISEKDILEAVRLQFNSNSLENIEEILLERNGEISVVKKQTIKR